MHPELFTDLVEVLGVAGRAAYAIEQLGSWLAEEERFADPAFYGTARAAIRYQPKGVVGNIVPWNFPFDLSLGPLVEMLAAGNRVIIKPSDYTPACAELLRDMISRTFPADLVAVAVGGLTLAKEFPTLRWDHLLYTGSPAIGREVALAAADNLVPVTLELGGKCPAILAEDSVDADSVRSVIGTKLIKNGQMCISVDYALVPRGQVDDFVQHAESYAANELGDYTGSGDCTGIITQRHMERIEAMLAEAQASGARIVTIGGDRNPSSRRLPLALVIDPPADLRIMQEEVFGPILPVVPYDDLPAAIARSTRASARSACTSTARMPSWPRACCGRPRPAARASTSARCRAPCPRSVSAVSARAAPAGITASRDSASSPTRAASWSAAPATWRTRSCRPTGRSRRRSSAACSTPRRPAAADPGGDA